MNAADIGLIVIFLLSSVIGIWRGLTKEVLSLISWIGSIVAAVMLFPVAQHIAQNHIQNPMIANALAGFVMFIVFLIFFTLITHIIASYVRDSALGGIDRSLGFAFGIGRAIFLVCAVELLLSGFVPRNQYPLVLKESRFVPMIQGWSEQLLTLVPPQLQSFILNQQQKFLHEHAQKDLDHQLESVLTNPLDHAVASATESLSRSASAPAPSLEAPVTVKPAEKLDPTSATQNLAVLKVQKKTDAKEQAYAAEQKQDLDRLIETVS